MDKKSVTLAVTAGIAIAVAIGGYLFWNNKKKKEKKFKAVYVKIHLNLQFYNSVLFRHFEYLRFHFNSLHFN